MKLDFNIKYRDAVENGSATVVTRDGRCAKDIKFNEDEKTITATIGSDDSSFRSIIASQNGLCRLDGWPTPDDLFIEFNAIPPKVTDIVDDFYKKYLAASVPNNDFFRFCYDLYFLGQCEGKLAQTKATLLSESTSEPVLEAQDITDTDKFRDEQLWIRPEDVDSIGTVADIKPAVSEHPPFEFVGDEAPMHTMEGDVKAKGAWDINEVKTFNDLMLTTNGEEAQDVLASRGNKPKLDGEETKAVREMLDRGEEAKEEAEEERCERSLKALNELIRLKGEEYLSYVNEITKRLEGFDKCKTVSTFDWAKEHFSNLWEDEKEDEAQPLCNNDSEIGRLNKELLEAHEEEKEAKQFMKNLEVLRYNANTEDFNKVKALADERYNDAQTRVKKTEAQLKKAVEKKKASKK